MRSWGLALTVALVGCEELGGGSTTETSAFSDLELDTMEQIDAYRSEQGLAPLSVDGFLGDLARAHSEDMLATDTLSHDGFDARADAIIADGAVSAAENVAFNKGFQDPVTTAVEGWIDSPGHHANIVGDFTHGGVGIAVRGDTVYLTHLFANRP